MADRLPVAKSAARIFLGELRPEDEALLIYRLEVTVMNLTTDRAQHAALNEIDAFGSTSSTMAVAAAIDANAERRTPRSCSLRRQRSIQHVTSSR